VLGVQYDGVGRGAAENIKNKPTTLDHETNPLILAKFPMALHNKNNFGILVDSSYLN
jgi:hypothetical protein